MLFSALRVSFAILFLRAGPQDMPFDSTPRLLREILLLTLIGYTAFGLVEFPLPSAIAASVLVIAAQWLTVRLTLATRNMQNRFQQTLTALLMTNTVLTLAMLPFFVMLAPALKDMFDQLQKHPELMDNPAQLPLLPAGPTLAFYLLGFLQFVVSVRIFCRAVDVNLLAGVLITMLAGLATSLFVTLMSPLISLLGS